MNSIHHVPTNLRPEALLDLLDRLGAVADKRGNCEGYALLLRLALVQIETLTARVREQSTEIRRLAARNRLLQQQARGWQPPHTRGRAA